VNRRFKTALFGAGRIGVGYADDAVMAAHIPFATHAQVLARHPAFSWVATVDPSDAARQRVMGRFPAIRAAAQVDDLPEREQIEVAVIATPPAARAGIVEQLPALRAVVVEKPLGPDLLSARKLLDTCDARGIRVQASLPRRADPDLRALASGGLAARIGAVQGGFGVYGNGLANNGTHLVDTVCALVGPVRSVQAIAPEAVFEEGPLAGDRNVSFVMHLDRGGPVMVQALRFAHYREVGLDLWGERGRLGLWHEGLTAQFSAVAAHRYASGERELLHDRPEVSMTGLGRALYGLYDNLAAALAENEPLVAPGAALLDTMVIVDAVRRSAVGGGQRIDIAPAAGRAA